MNVSLAVWLLTLAALCALVGVDFLVGRTPHDVSVKEAGTWTIVWVVLACLFGLGLFLFGGGGPTGEFFAGYITEKSLSVDNLFVFVLIMGKFAVPSQYQQRVLMVGVLTALVVHALRESGVHVPEIGIPFSLGFIVLVLTITTISSLRAAAAVWSVADSPCAAAFAREGTASRRHPPPPCSRTRRPRPRRPPRGPTSRASSRSRTRSRGRWSPRGSPGTCR
ncbi:TerC family protein [Streptomyces griseoruber]|uniref:TerC family protein n=1 Tax=Streptomyces griseoruber TaxID=1943 RepID=UPI0037ADF90A